MDHNAEIPREPRPEATYQPTQGMTEAGKAQSLAIPLEHQARPDVQEFVSLATRLDNLVADLLIAEDRHSADARLARVRDDLAAPDMTPPLNARYAAAKDLALVAKTILEEGVGPISTEYKGF